MSGAEKPKPWLATVVRNDVPASIVVFLVALPLCLGIAVASGAPPLAGLVSGIVGGIVVAAISGSPLAVTGPAAGLAAIVLIGIETVGYEGLLLATVIAGGLQILLGALRAGIFAYYFPSSVIKGMLAAIGLILILKQIPHALGWDADYEGDLGFLQPDHRNTFSEIIDALEHVHPGTTAIALIGLVVLVGLDRSGLGKRMRLLPAPLLVVLIGVGLALVFGHSAPHLALSSELMVSLPVGGPVEVARELHTPGFASITDSRVWELGLTIAIVASLETLLCLEAMDKLDPDKRVTSTNRELVAQGVGNVVAGLLGGLPVTAVIVRGAANVQSGARSKASAILHGVWLTAAVLVLAGVINLIPLAALAAILLHVGYKLTPIALYRGMLRRSSEQWAPFLVTVIAVVFTDLLKGVGIGMAVGIFYILRANLKTPFFIHHREVHAESDGRPHVLIQLSENVSFLNKASVSKVLSEMSSGCIVEIDGSTSQFIHPDVLEIISEFEESAPRRGIEVILSDIPAHRRSLVEPAPVTEKRAA